MAIKKHTGKTQKAPVVRWNDFRAFAQQITSNLAQLTAVVNLTFNSVNSLLEFLISKDVIIEKQWKEFLKEKIKKIKEDNNDKIMEKGSKIVDEKR